MSCFGKLSALMREIEGFFARGLWRMKQLYETYGDFLKLSSMVTEFR